MQIFKQFTFDSAHHLPMVPEGHKCKEIHGHTYRVVFHFKGKINPEYGWVVDFSVIKSVIEPIIRSVDHKLLNHVAGLENPTCEMMALWFWNQVKPQIESLYRIELHETPTSGAIYEGE